MLYTLMPFVWGCHDPPRWGRGSVWEMWSVTIISVQSHGLLRLLIEPAAGTWVEEHVTRES